MKYFVGSYVFPYSWDIVAKTLWVRYPNSYSTHVLSEDTLDRYVEDGKLFSRRLLVKTNPLPKWAERFASKRYVSIVEESIVDPENETVVTYTRNVGYTHVMSVIERVVYTKTDESALGSENVGTLADRSAWISSSLKGFCFAIEKFGIERFKHNTKKANAGYLEAIQNMLGQNNGGPGNPYSLPAAVSSSREKLRNAAARAKELRELAKSKAEPVYAACQQREDVPAA